ncbi:MAG: hypothetical protein RID07_12635, partial [Lacipirellulaceae bacterium]
MRLTLRTLLAYMDDILDPADHEELGRKIESSDFATELIHRTRDTVRRTKLAAPDVDAGDNDEVLGGTPNLDANAVAEYLDNTMPPEQVAVFERQCLEMGMDADMRLAEVASCHHILTMVLGEPADVPTEVRERMYSLKAKAEAMMAAAGQSADPIGEKLRIEPAHADAVGETGEPTNTAAEAAEPVAPPVAAVREEPRETKASDSKEVPDYLRTAAASERRSRNTKLAIAAALVLGLSLTYLFWPQGPVEVSNEVAQSMPEDVDGGLEIEDPLAGGESSGADMPVPEATGDGPPPFDPSGAEGDGPPPFVPGTPAENGDGPTSKDDATGEEAGGGGDELPDLPPRVEDPNYRKGDEGREIEPLGPIDVETFDTESPSEPSGDSTTRIGPDMKEPPTEDATESEPSGPPPVPVPPTSEEEEPTEEGPTKEEATEDDESEPSEEAVVAEPAEPVVVGQFQASADAESMLLGWSRNDKLWKRLTGDGSVFSSQQVLVLPKFRANLLLNKDVRAALLGGTRVRFLAVEEVDQQQPADVALELLFGQMQLTTGAEESRVTITSGESSHTFDL